MMDTDTRHRLKTPNLFYRRSLVEADAARRYRLNALLALQDPPTPLADRLLWGAVVLVVGGLLGWAFCQRPVLDALVPLLGVLP